MVVTMPRLQTAKNIIGVMLLAISSGSFPYTIGEMTAKIFITEAAVRASAHTVW